MSAGRRWVAIEHVPYEGPAAIATAAAARGVELEVCRPYLGERLPIPGELAGLVVMGGPMGVSDTDAHPYLAGELELIAALVAAERPLLGVCLGAQLLAAALGARVYRGPVAEYGAGTVSLTAEGRLDPVLGDALTVDGHDAGRGEDAGYELPVVHWHQDTFELPAGAVQLASSAVYPQQAFRLGVCAYGFQFHVEVDRELAEGWRAHLPAGVEIGTDEREAVERVGRPILAAFFAAAISQSAEAELV